MARTTTEPAISPVKKGWHSIATFTVAFQTQQLEGHAEHRTTIYHLESDSTKTLPSFGTEQLQDWLLTQAKVASLLTAISPESSVTSPTLAVEITRLRVLQAGQTSLPMTADQTDPLFATSLATNVPFVLELAVTVAQTEIARLSNQLLIYAANAQARHLATGELIQLGSVEMSFLLGEKNTCMLMLPKATLQKAGAYRLQVCAEIKNLPSTPGYFKVPLLQLA
jgi:hypothetical protein